MKKEEHIVSYTAEQLDEMIARGQSQTDWQRVASMTDEEIEQNAEIDLDSPQYPYREDFWQDAELVSPKKQTMSQEKLGKAKKLWEEKLAHYEYELAITSSVSEKFELRERIRECQAELDRLSNQSSEEKENSQTEQPNIRNIYVNQGNYNERIQGDYYDNKTNSNINSAQEAQMKGINWLHLSDWHQRGEEFGRQVVRDKLIEDIQKRSKISPHLAKIDFIIFSGDLANSGGQQEYEAAQRYLLDPVLKATGLNPDQLFFVPGNHDFERKKMELLPSKIIVPFQNEDDVNEWLSDQDKRNEILKPFRAYKEFINQYNNQNQPEYASVQILEIYDKKVGLLGINSALMTARNKDGNGRIADQGFLVVGEPQIHTSLQSIGDCEIKIAVLHHPFDWLVEFDRRRIKRLLGQGCHFILCGHEHQSRVERVNGTDGDYIFIPAGASYNRPNFPNSYNFVNLNFDNNQATIYFRKWSRDRNKWIKNEDVNNNGLFEINSLPKQLK